MIKIKFIFLKILEHSNLNFNNIYFYPYGEYG